MLLELPQETTIGREKSTCKSGTLSGCASYTLHYQVSQVAAKVTPTLSQAGLDLYDEYVVTYEQVGDQVEVPDPFQDWGTPGDIFVKQGEPPVVLDLEDFDPQQGPEPNNLFEMSEEELAEMIALASEEDPEGLDSWLTAVRENALEALGSPREEESADKSGGTQSVFPEQLLGAILRRF